ncbi:hypothetical protein H4S14_000283 [Agrobacterium vitis]|nr:hypothetical protein [Agrobacterium vitis]MBE1436556.1 hypothetical protein [Agrobacterium vitis]
MLIATFGPSSAFTHWCVNALNTISSIVLGEFDYVSVSTIQDFKIALASRKSKHVHLYTNFPDRGLIEAFQKSHIPFLAIVEDPDDITGFLMRDLSCSWMHALRLTNLSFATIADLCSSPTALRLSRSNRLTLGRFVEQVINHLGLEVDQEQFDNILERFLPGGGAMSHVEDALLRQIPSAMPIGHKPDLPDLEQSIIKLLHSGMRYDNDGKIPQTFRWPSELLIGHEGVDHVLRQPIEMLGPARFLVYGPYLHLPAGDWEITLPLEITENLSGNWIDVDVINEIVLHAESFKLPVSGRMALILKFSISESRVPVNIRIFQRQGAIEGKLQIGDILIRNLADETAPF